METSFEGYIVDESGKRTAVVIPIEEYESLLRGLQDTQPEVTIQNLLEHRELKATLSQEWSA